MINLPLISLGIPIYNAVDLVERTVLSALNQTYPYIEFLFIDDKGNSMDVVRQLVSEHKRGGAVRIIDQVNNQGTGSARNAIVDNASGEYLFTMDCDDIITPDCIDILYKKMKEHPVDFISASFVRSDLQGNPLSKVFRYDDVLVKDGDYAVAEYRYGKGQYISVPTWNKLYRTSFLRENKIRCIPHYLIDDTWFMYQVILNARSCRLIPDCTLFFTYNPQSVTTVKDNEGYTASLAEQYLETEILKAHYIRSLRHRQLYMGLAFDTMKMSLYHLYRSYSSTRISRNEKVKLLKGFLTRHFSYPCFWNPLDKNMYLSALFLLFYGLPMWMKIFIVRFIVFINLRKIIGRWFHF